MAKKASEKGEDESEEEVTENVTQKLEGESHEDEEIGMVDGGCPI